MYITGISFNPHKNIKTRSSYKNNVNTTSSNVNFHGKVKITSKLISFIRREYSLGKTMQQIATLLCGMGTIISYLHIGKLLKKQPDWEKIQDKHKENYVNPVKTISPDEESEMAEMYSNGHSIKDIAKKTGHKIGRILYCLSGRSDYNDLSEKHVLNNKTGRFIQNDENVKNIICMYRAGKPVDIIAKEMKCSNSTVTKYINLAPDRQELEEEHIKNYQGKNSIITEALVEKMAAMYRAGDSYKKIAQALGCSKSIVVEYLKNRDDADENNIMHYKNMKKRTGHPPKNINKNILNQIVELYTEGYPIENIATTIGYNRETVTKYLRMHPNYQNMKLLHIKNNKGANTIITPEILEDMVVLYREGKTTREIACIYKCSSSAVSTNIQLHPDSKDIYEEHRKNYKGLQRKVTADEHKQMVKQYENGVEVKKIANDTGYTDSTIRRHLKQNSKPS